MSVFVAIIKRTNLEILSLLRSNTPGRITTYIERSAMPTPMQPMPNFRRAMFTLDWTYFDILPVLSTTSLNLTSSIQWGSACMTTSSSGFSTSWRPANGSTSTMQSAYPCLLTMTSPQKISQRKKFLNGMERIWRKWAGTCLELYPSFYEMEAPLSIPYSIAQLSAHGHS